MATSIIYTDFNDNVLTSQQLLQTKNFVKQVYVDAQLKSRDAQEVLNGELFKKLDYFLDDSTENKDIIAQQYCNSEENASCTVYYDRQMINGYSLWTPHYYSIEGISLGDGGQEVYDGLNRCIYASSFIDNTTQIRTVTKIMYPQLPGNFDRQALLLFHFTPDTDTGLMKMTISDGDDNFHWLMPQDFTIEFLQSEGLWDEYSYYHSHLPVIPEPGTI